MVVYRNLCQIHRIAKVTPALGQIADTISEGQLLHDEACRMSQLLKLGIKTYLLCWPLLKKCIELHVYKQKDV